MNELIVEIANDLMICFLAFYTFACFAVFAGKNNKEKQKKVFGHQIRLIYLLHLTAYLTIYAITDDLQNVLFYFLQVFFLAAILLCYRFLYPKASQLVVNNLCMLLAIGFVILTRLSETKALRQFVFAVAAFVITLCIPYLIRKIKGLRNMTWVYAAAGVLALLAVLVFGATSYGAKISISVFGITVQPSEFVKILFVFFVAGMLHGAADFRQVCITTVVAAAHVLILVASRDLGGALIFFVTYLVMLYVATKKLLYFLGGIAVGSVASVAAYFLFSHVRVRVLAWQDPLSVVENEGYQISQSLFGIGTGGWFGMGLYHGAPNKIPVVEQDFIFAAISEELGGAFALCLIMVCVSCFIMFLNIAMQMKDRFYKLTALGLGTVYAVQVFLNIGGNIKFIPSTGVTLPLVSYGGSSLLSTMILFAVIQGLYVLRDEEGAENERDKTAKINKRGDRKTGFDSEIERFT